MEIKAFRKIYRDMINFIASHQKRITDFNDGGGLTSLVEAFAREVAELYRRCRVGFSTFLRSLPYSIFGFQMKAGTKASTVVRFHRAKPYNYESPIPENSIIGAGDLRYLTVGPCVVPTGETLSTPTEAIAIDIGEKYNVDAGMINKVLSTLSADIKGVTNEQPATGGKSNETWRDYVARFGQYILGLQRTNGAGFYTALTSGNAVRSLEIIEHFPPVDNLWNITVYLEDGSGKMSEKGIKRVKKIIDGNGRTPKNAGYRAPGINVRYMSPEIVYIDLDITVVTKQDVTNEIEESVVITEVDKRAREHINGLWIAQAYIKSNLTVILKRIQYLDDVKIKTDNIVIERHQILRLGSCAVKVEVGR